MAEILYESDEEKNIYDELIKLQIPSDDIVKTTLTYESENFIYSIEKDENSQEEYSLNTYFSNYNIGELKIKEAD